MPAPARDPELDAANEAYFEKTRNAFRDLFDRARAANEFQFLIALGSEFRGLQAPGWNTAHEAHVAFDEYLAFINDGELTPLKARISLAFYCHVAEASGFYETPKNMLRILDGRPAIMWPFDEIVQVHQDTGRVIAPNANKVMKNLAGHAETLGLQPLAEVIRDAFDADLRNGYAHADYIVWDDGIRLRRRNGGHATTVSWLKYDHLFHRGINFFEILSDTVRVAMNSYNPAKSFVGREGGGHPVNGTAQYDPASGSFRITW